MNINIEQFEQFAEKGILVQHNWGNLKTTACLISSLAGETSIKKCASSGWPQWLAEIGVWLFDSAPDIETAIVDGRLFAVAVKKADEKGVDFDNVYSQARLNAILPIALEAVGEGSEPWRIECRSVVLDAIDLVGKKPSATMTAYAADVAGAAGAAGAADAAYAAYAAGAAGAAGAAYDAARTKIIDSLIEALEAR